MPPDSWWCEASPNPASRSERDHRPPAREGRRRCGAGTGRPRRPTAARRCGARPCRSRSRCPTARSGCAGSRRRAGRSCPPGRTTRPSSAKNAGSSTRLRSANPHVTPSTDSIGHRQAQDVGLHARRAATGRRRASRRLRSTEIGWWPARARSMHRSPVPLARSRTRLPGAQLEGAHRSPPPAHVEAERHDAIDQVVPRRDGVEHVADGADLVVALRKRFAIPRCRLVPTARSRG